jgi:DNA modification methylase
MAKIEKTWVSVSGRLEPIAFDGPSYIRFPLDVAELVIETFSAPGKWVLDPFCGFGTTIVAAQRLGRQAVGFEKSQGRAEFATARAVLPNRVVYDDMRRMGDYDLPVFDLLFTSPPYTSFRTSDAEGASHYFDDLVECFGEAGKHVRPGSTVVVNVANMREAAGIRTVAWDAAIVLSRLFEFQGEIVRCNSETSDESLGGYDHVYLLVFRKR